MNDPFPWSNKQTSDDAAPTLDDLHRLFEELKQNPVPARFEAGTRMYLFLRDSLTAAGQPCTPFPCGIPVILREDMPSELGHLYDTNDRMIKSFIWKEGEDGPKILVVTHPGPDELFKYWRHDDVQRAPEGPVREEPRIYGRMADYAPCLTYRAYGDPGSRKVRLDTEGTGSPDGGEPGEDQKG